MAIDDSRLCPKGFSRTTLLFLSANFESFNAFDIGPKAPDGVEK